MTNAEILARKIRNRTTELQHAFSAYQNQHYNAVMEENRAGALVASAAAGMEMCRKRAREQGYPNLFD